MLKRFTVISIIKFKHQNYELHNKLRLQIFIAYDFNTILQFYPRLVLYNLIQ